MKAEQKFALGQLEKALLVNNYAMLIDLFTNSRVNNAPWITCTTDMVDKLPSKQKILMQLFHLGQWTDGAENALERDVLAVLEKMGILEHKDGMWRTRNLLIFPYNGLHIISQKWKPGESSSFDQVWIGADSLCLARLLPGAKGKKVLDLCAGTGILGLVMASRGAEVTSVEINPEAVKLCKWNIMLNKLEDAIQVFEGSLYEPVKGDEFDFIISNPPYIPLIEDEEAGLLFGSAGDDGLKILRLIIEEIDKYLAPSGRAVFIAGGFGNNDAPFFAEELADYANEKRMEMNLIVYGKKKAAEELDHIEKVLPVVNKCFTRINGDESIMNSKYYHFILTIHNSVKKAGKFNIVFCFSSLKDSFKFLKEGGNQ